MTSHAETVRRERHKVAGIRIRVAALAGQAECQMGLVAIGNRLRWWCSLQRIAGHFFSRCLGLHLLSQSKDENKKPQRMYHFQSYSPLLFLSQHRNLLSADISLAAALLRCWCQNL